MASARSAPEVPARRPPAPAPRAWWVPVCAGTLSGITTAGVFNPYDRALYLSVIHEKPFLHGSNWSKPFQGAANALLHRTVAGGLYFAVYDILQKPVARMVAAAASRHSSDASVPGERLLPSDDIMVSFATGTLAGFANGVILNPIAAVKYAAWGSDTSEGLQRYAVSLWQHGGVRPFIAGIVPTVVRDMVFGASYSTLRFMFARELAKRISPFVDGGGGDEMGSISPNLVSPLSQFAGAAIATTVSSPFNYWRNMQFDTKPGQQPVGFVSCMRQLGCAVRGAPGIQAKCLQVSMKLRIGWGTFRVATGMAVGQQLYDFFAHKINPDEDLL
jgi:hypothetical protein